MFHEDDFKTLEFDCSERGDFSTHKIGFMLTNFEQDLSITITNLRGGEVIVNNSNCDIEDIYSRRHLTSILLALLVV